MAKTNQKLDFRSVFLLGINSIIGSGIFLLPGQIYANLHNWSLLIILIASLATFSILLCFADLSSKFTGDGSSWIYTYSAYGRFAGFEVGFDTWVTAIIQLASEVAALLTTLKLLLPVLNDRFAYNVAAVLIIIGLGTINLFGDHFLSIVDNIASVTKIVLLLGFIIGGAFFMTWGNFAHPLEFHQLGLANVTGRFNSSLSVILIIFTGFSFLPVAAAQMQNSEKNLPKALVSVMVTTTVLYLLVQVVAIGILGPAISASSVPVATAFKAAFGLFGYYLILFGMVVSIFGVAISLSFNAPVVAASLANEHQLLPSIIAKSNKHGAAYIAILISCLFAIGLLLSGGYLFLVACVVITSFIQYIPTILATIKYRHNDHLPKGFRLPLGMTIPIIALLVSAYLMFSFTLPVLLIGIGILVAGGLLYLLDDHKDQTVHQQVPPQTQSQQ